MNLLKKIKYIVLRVCLNNFKNLKYKSYKENSIKNILNDKQFITNFENLKNFNLPLFLDERIIEYPFIFSKIKNDKGTNILDAGSILNHEFLVEHNFIKNNNLSIMTLYPEKYCFFNNNISYIYGDLRNKFFTNNFFDTVICGSTIEHIGLNNEKFYSPSNKYNESSHNDYENVIKEFHRILKSGGKLLLTFPFGKRNVYDWIQIFDESIIKNIISIFKPQKSHVRIFKNTGKSWIESDFKQSANSIYRSKEINFDDSTYLIPAAESVACIELIKR
jgi:SAM-dependent methyltransferase